MIPEAFTYERAGSVAEALEHMGRGALPLAGGHSLVPALKLRLSAPEALVDIARIPELSGIRVEGGTLVIGACTRHRVVAASAEVKANAAALAAAAPGDRRPAGAQPRHHRRLAGAGRSARRPAAVALALGAEIVAQSASGTRTIAADDFFVDYYTTALEEGELITEIRIPGGQSQGAYAKFSRRAQDWAIIAAAVSKGAGGWRVGLCGAAATALRASGRGGGAGLRRLGRRGRGARQRGHRAIGRPGRLDGVQAPSRHRDGAQGARGRRRVDVLTELQREWLGCVERVGVPARGQAGCLFKSLGVLPRSPGTHSPRTYPGIPREVRASGLRVVAALAGEPARSARTARAQAIHALQTPRSFELERRESSRRLIRCRELPAPDCTTLAAVAVIELAAATLRGAHPDTHVRRIVMGPMDLRVEAGEHWVVLGPNGAGKTSLLLLAAAVEHPYSGTVTVLGGRLGRVDIRDLREHIGFVQGRLVDEFEPWSSVREGHARRRHRDDSRTRGAADRRRPGARSACCSSASAARAGSSSASRSLSEGERRRVLVARALMNQPPLLLLDEPTASLDLPGRETVIGALERLAADEPELATVTVVHHVEDIPACATHALLMREGASVAQGPVGVGAHPGDAERRLRARDRAPPPGAAARGDRQNDLTATAATSSWRPWRAALRS